jgi:sulfite reductase (NADPH) hemoprotein beta-component
MTLAPARPYAFTRSGDALGWTEGDDGRWHFALFIENGRVGGDLLASLHTVAEAHRGTFILTPNQNLIIAGIAPEDHSAIAALLATLRLANPASGLRRNAMACVALPTCGLALAESERTLPGLLTRLEVELARHGLSDEEITIRMTGCPNGCARPYLAEIGLVGRGPGTYHLYLGGAFDGTRMNKLYRRDLKEDGIVAALSPLFASYAAERREGETFADFTIRTGVVAPTTAGNRFHEDVAEAA